MLVTLSNSNGRIRKRILSRVRTSYYMIRPFGVTKSCHMSPTRSAPRRGKKPGAGYCIARASETVLFVQ